MKEYKFDKFTHEDYLKSCADLSKDNEYCVETAGFIPLEVKLKQFEQNGIIAQFQVSDFDSNDYRDIYLSPDFNITPEDDFEDVQEKLNARNEFIEQLKKSKKVAKGDNVAESDKPAAKAAEQKESVEKEDKLKE